MPTFDLLKFASLNADDIERFRLDGFLIIERCLSEDTVIALRERFPKLFAGQFDTGIYPDEWYWREGMSLPDVTRHMANAWKADLTVAKLALGGCRPNGGATRGLVGRTARSRHHLVESAQNQTGRPSSGFLLYGFPRSG